MAVSLDGKIAGAYMDTQAAEIAFEEYERQHLGHIDSGVEIFEETGDVDVTFELVSD